MADKGSSPAFEIDDRIRLSVERELAAFVGGLILATNTKNTAALALGHQLKKLSDSKPKMEEEPPTLS